MTDPNTVNPPSPFIARWVARLAPSSPRAASALDVACGRGRHAVLMAKAGFTVTAVDLQFDALRQMAAEARAGGVRVSAVCADLTGCPLPVAQFQLIVVSRYLDRQLFPALREALAPGGTLLYETFTEHQLRYDRGPRSRRHLLAPGELRLAMRGMEVLFDEEVTAPDALARIAVRRA